MKSSDVLLKVDNLVKHFPIRKGVFKKVVGQVKAIDGVTFSINQGETLGLVGESGCGKTTVGRCILRLIEPTKGRILFRNVNDQMIDLLSLDNAQMKKIRRRIQIIFQDPYSSLDPRMSVRDIIAQPLKIHRIGTPQERIKRVEELMERVGLSVYHMNRFPHEFSGGQRQRIGIARALALNPKLIVCDEPVSALDVSIQAQVLNLLTDLQAELGLTYLFISHNLSVVAHISDRVMVMYLGKIVEIAATDDLYKTPQHPYTEALLQAIPIPDSRTNKNRQLLEGAVPDPTNPPPGCNFHTRCRYAQEICSRQEPGLIALPGQTNHFVACHLAGKLNLASIPSAAGD